MIILSGVLVVVAIALLVAGIVAGNGDSAQVFGLDALVVIYISIAVSIVSALCLAIGVFLRRKELFGPGASPGPARPGKKAQKAKKDKRAKRAESAPVAPAPAKDAQDAAAAEPPAGPPADPADDEAEIPAPAPAVDVPDDALVFVVRGRKRYHLDTCRQLAGRDTEELTYAEAKEEGFSPCTACLPDTALAARAAASAPAPSGTGEAAEAEPANREPAAERSESGLAGLAKPAPTSFDKPGAFERPGALDKPSAFERPGALDEPGAFDATAEIPRTGEHTADETEDRDTEDAGARKRGTAAPTRTDMPVAGLFASGDAAEEAPKSSQKAEDADAQADDLRDAERDAATESAPPDVTVDLGTAPFGGADAEDVPAPGHEPSDAELAGEPEPSAGDTADEAADDGPQVRILSGTKRYHRVDCALIEDIGDEADDLESLSRAEAKARGCTPCLVCQPDREHARD